MIQVVQIQRGLQIGHIRSKMFSKTTVLLLVITCVFQAHCGPLDVLTSPALTEEQKRGLLDNPNLAGYLQQLLSYINGQGATQSSSQNVQSAGVSSSVAEQSLSQSSSSSTSSSAVSKQTSSSLSSSSQNSANVQNVANQVAQIINKGEGAEVTTGEGKHHGSSLISELGVSNQVGSISNSGVSSSQSSTASTSSSSVSSQESSLIASSSSENSAIVQNGASQVAAILANGQSGGTEKITEGAVVSQGSSLLGDFGASSVGSVSSNSVSSNSVSSDSSVSSSSSSTSSSTSSSSNSAASHGGSLISLNEISNVNSGSIGGVASSSSLLNQGSTSSSVSSQNSLLQNVASTASSTSTASESALLQHHGHHSGSAEGQYVNSEEALHQAKNAKYHFSMFVDDNIQGLLQEKEEIRENGIVRGAFAYDDGHIRRIVNYHDNGHGMVITRDDITPSQKAKGQLNGRVTVRTTTNGQTVSYSYTANDIAHYKNRGQVVAAPV